MKKNFLTRAAAVSIAAIAAMSATAATVSADITTNSGTVSGSPEMSGSLIYTKWYLKYTTKGYTAKFSGTARSINFNLVEDAYSSNEALAPASLNYDMYNKTGWTSDNSQGMYFSKSSISSAALSELSNVATYQNKTGKDTVEATDIANYKPVTATTLYKAGGTDEKEIFRQTFANYVHDFNAYWSAYTQWETAYNAWNVSSTKDTVAAPNQADYKWVDYTGLQRTAETANKPADTTAITNTVYTLKTYTLDKSTDTVAISSLTANSPTGGYKYATIDTKGIVTVYQSLPSLVGATVYTLVTSGTASDTSTLIPSSAYCYGETGTAYYASNGYYYPSRAAASACGATVTSAVASNGYSTSYPYFDYTTGQYTSYGAGTSYYIYGLTSGSTTTSYGSYQSSNGLYYTTASAAQAASYAYNGTNTCVTKYTTNSGNYFSMYTGEYYSSYDVALSASKNNSSYVVTVSGATTSGNAFYNSYTGKYYPTYAMAYAAATVGKITSYSRSTLGDYFNMKNGIYYSSSTAAANASSAADVYVVSQGVMLTNSNYDPYYYYFQGGTTNTNYDESEPTIYGAKRRSGWTYINSVIKSTKSGSTVNIDMKSASDINKTILATAKAYGVNLKIVTSNGAIVTIKASSIDTAKAVDMGIKYNTTNIPSTLVNKAKKLNVGTKSTAQITIGDGTSFGLTATAQVKFNKSRAGLTAKIYRYNASRNSLVLAGTTTIAENGAASFNLTKGGEFVVIVK